LRCPGLRQNRGERGDDDTHIAVLPDRELAARNRSGARPSYRGWQQRLSRTVPAGVLIETIDHSQQRYPTVGDWQIDKAGNLHITVSKMRDQRYEFLVGMHEVIEAYLALHAGVSPEAVDKFDEAYEARRKPGDDSEPGDDPRAPYHQQHVFAEKIERLLARELGVDWSAYSKEVESK
jgi:hypothetical protein